ncbi:MAG: hypothetical protein ACYC0V_21755 [Armatimonadota bacterium]
MCFDSLTRCRRLENTWYCHRIQAQYLVVELGGSHQDSEKRPENREKLGNMWGSGREPRLQDSNAQIVKSVASTLVKQQDPASIADRAKWLRELFVIRYWLTELAYNETLSTHSQPLSGTKG